MGEKSARKNDPGERETDNANRSAAQTRENTTDERSNAPGEGYVEYERGLDRRALSERYGMEVRKAEAGKLQRLEREFGSERVQRWAEEGMSVETMGKPRDMEAFRKRQEARSEEIPTDVERRNEASRQRNEARNREGGRAGEAGAPEAVRRVVSSPGRSMDGTVQREMEAKMGGEFGDVQLHTGPQAAAAAESINARAFTVGNHVAFNRGEYRPDTDDGKRVLAHELTHVRQQTAGAVSLLPKADAERSDAGVTVDAGVHVQPKLEVSSPDDPAEKEAEEVAQAVTEMDDEGVMGAAPDATAAAGGVGSGNADRAETGLDGPGAEAGVGEALSEVEALYDDGPLHARLGAGSQGGRTGRGAESRGSPSGPAAGSGTVQAPDRSGSLRGSAVESGTERHIPSMDGSGKPLPPSERSFFESRFGSDFGAVRIHTGDGANELARKLGARAFTLGNHVGFADGEYNPGSTAGRRLIAHELTHTIQQAGNRPVPSAAGESSAADPAEREAEAVADRVMNHEPPGRIQRTSTTLQLRNGRGRNRQRARLRSQVFIRKLNENLNKLKVSEVKIGRVRGTYGGNRSGGRSGGERGSSGGGEATGRAQQGPRRPPGERQGRGPGMPGGPGTPSDPVAATAAAFAVITQKEKDPANARVSTFVEARVFLYHVAKRRSASIPATVYTVYEMRPGAPIIAVALEGSKDRAEQLVKDLNSDEDLDSTFAMRKSSELSKKFREFQTKVFTGPSMTE